MAAGMCSSGLLLACLVAPRPLGAQAAAQPPSAAFDVRDYGAAGDGTTLDTDAIQAAVDAAAAAGGGSVLFPAGTYPSFSIRLRSHVALWLGRGATLLAADPAEYEGGYDPPEPNPWGDEHEYQDFGHSHWHNSLLWGEGLEDVAVLGPGTIDGAGLWRGLYPPLGPAPGPDPGNKAIALRLSRNVTIRDVTIFRGGHFAILATGVDDLTIDHVRIDTNRDGIDLDGCRNVRISDVSVNSPNDDAIVLKSSYALGEARVTEDVTITNSLVSGWDLGTMLDGTYGRTGERAPDRDGPAGRIKFGTESNGGFRNVTISNVVFDHSRGLALETVDGGLLEDVAVSNITMRDVSNAPFFLRLGRRMRGPDGAPVGALRRVSISNVVVYGADPRFPAIVSGIPDHPVEDVTFSHVRIYHRGGVTMDQVARQPDDMVNRFFLDEASAGPRDPWDVPERETAYPEASMFGLLPAWGFYIRHARGVELHDVEIHLLQADERLPVVLQDVAGAGFFRLRVDGVEATPVFMLEEVRDFRVALSDPVGDVERAYVRRETF